jgi:NAD(P)-dependent dehydrogenase (short-subunit alcohol dehydrogenase family)
MSHPDAALVTGCSGGIGRATALALVRAGIPTWATARQPDRIADLAAAGCRTLQLDVTDEESRVRAVKTIEAEHGSVGVLVNNAGYAQAGPIEEVSLDLVRHQFETNVYGLMRMCQLVLPKMRAKSRGTIINIGSAAGLMGVPATGTYAMSKWSVEALSDALRYEVRDFGVRVVLLEPGGVITTGFAAAEHETWPPTPGPYEIFQRNHRARMSGWTNDNARGMSTPEEVARVVVRAARAAHPRARYKIGVAPRIMPLMYRLLPSRLWDGFWARQFPVTDR